MAKDEIEISALEAARRLGVGLDYLYSLVWIGKLSGRKEGRKWRISVSSVETRLRVLRGQRG